MKVIVFTMAYNAQETIGRTIESILNQTFDDFEYYVLDNGATDHTSDVIYKYAQADERVRHIAVNKNDPENGGAFFLTLAFASDADYIVWCDADDTYSLDFLEKMTEFAQQNSLDIAACGYESIDGATGRVLKRRVTERNLIIQECLFTEMFIQYRGFTGALWGKLYSIPFLKSLRCAGGSKEKFRYHGESTWILELFWRAKRVGVFGEAMYQWYQYPHSLSRINCTENMKQYPKYWTATKEYLERYGPLSKLNEDFLYAIYLSLAEEEINFIFESELSTKEKLQLLGDLFCEPLWSETMAREADPQFRNLAVRESLIQQIKKRILELPNTRKEQQLAEMIIYQLNIKGTDHEKI